MMNGTYAVVYGRTDALHEGEGLNTIFLADVEAVKEMARQFIKVIPDDLEGYEKDIKRWTGKNVLSFAHQDDDTFYFSATPFTAFAKNMKKFNEFVAEFNAD